VRDSHGNTGRHERALAGSQLDILGAAQVDARVAVVSSAGHRQVTV
jgi:hypothetical protein